MYKEDRVCVPESHVEETLRWCQTVHAHPAVQRSLWLLGRQLHCKRKKSEKEKPMTAVPKNCHCIFGEANTIKSITAEWETCSYFIW